PSRKASTSQEEPPWRRFGTDVACASVSETDRSVWCLGQRCGHRRKEIQPLPTTVAAVNVKRISRVDRGQAKHLCPLPAVQTGVRGEQEVGRLWWNHQGAARWPNLVETVRHVVPIALLGIATFHVRDVGGHHLVQGAATA